MFGSLILAATVALQVQVQAGKSGDTVSVGIRVGGGPLGAGMRRRAVTANDIATAFRDTLARTMLMGARRARLRQDSALISYDAKARQRISVGMSLRENGRERLMVRDEGVARIQWRHGVGAVVDMLGKRTTIPAADQPEQVDDGVRRELQLPIPYFPDKETLWIGASMVETSVDEESFVHPIARGSEAYYRYASGDSMSYTLSNNQRISLRELRVEAREPHWNLIVGSFWFDAASWQLVRAVYRPSIEMNIWEVATEQMARDSSNKDDMPPWWVRGFVSPLKVTMHVFTVEYGLFEGRFWLPTAQGAEGRAQAMMIRVPVTFEEKYEYASVNGTVDVDVPMSKLRAPPLGRFAFIQDSLNKAGVLDKAERDSMARSIFYADSAQRNARNRARNDSLSAVAKARREAQRDSLSRLGFNSKQIDSVLRAVILARRDSVREAEEKACKDVGYMARRLREYGNTVDVILRTPCDLQSLAKSPELPPSAFDAGEDVFDRRAREELLGALDFGLQAGWGPQKISIDWGFSQTRYNRVEGLSSGLALRQELGRGLAWNAKLRAGQGDKQLNGELGVERTNGRAVFRLNVYRRLVSASDWGTPLTFSSSLPALVGGRDEGIYYRAWGGELIRTSDRGKRVDWRLFAEEEWSAPVTTRFSLFGGTHNKAFKANVDASRETFAGASMRWRQSWGLEPGAWNTQLDLRLEGAGGTQEYGRGALDMTVSHALFKEASFAITGAAGSSVGDLPAQRNWFLGGVATVRGQYVGIDSVHSGNAFWFGRLELARDTRGNRLSVFGDLGWAGSRGSDWGRSHRLLSGVGVGSSFLQGLLRTDVSRGLWPRKGWRLDFSLEAPF